MAANLEELPAPLKREILSYLLLVDLQNCRLVCSSFCELANEHAFYSLRLMIDSESSRIFDEIARSDRLRKHVRKVTIETALEDYEYVRLWR